MPVALSTLCFALICTLVQHHARLRPLAVALLALAAGLFHRYVNGATMVPGGADRLALFGAVATLFCVVALVAAEVTTLAGGLAAHRCACGRQLDRRRRRPDARLAGAAVVLKSGK